MPLDTAALAAPQLVQLDPTVWDARLKAFKQAKLDKAAADKLSRNLDTALKATSKELQALLTGAPAAMCGNMVITAKATAGAAASLTLTNGQTVPFSSITAFLIGNMQIKASDVSRLFGGRDGYVSIDVT